MTDEEICEGLVRLGIASEHQFGERLYYYISGTILRRLSLNAEVFTRDWRVAGACLENFPRREGESLRRAFERCVEYGKNFSDPRAICAATVRAARCTTQNEDNHA